VGFSNTANGVSSIAAGANNTASGISSIALGYQASTQGITGKMAIANAQITSLGDNQY